MDEMEVAGRCLLLRAREEEKEQTGTALQDAMGLGSVPTRPASLSLSLSGSEASQELLARVK